MPADYHTCGMCKRLSPPQPNIHWHTCTRWQTHRTLPPAGFRVNAGLCPDYKPGRFKDWKYSKTCLARRTQRHDQVTPRRVAAGYTFVMLGEG